MKSIIQDQLRDPAGWKDGLYYPDGFGKAGFGINISPDGQVWFPMVKPENGEGQKPTQETVQPLQEPVTSHQLIDLPIPEKLSVTKCLICGNTVPGKRIDRKYCSPKCRQQASRGKQLHLAGLEL